jgi:hypothetical protein
MVPDAPEMPITRRRGVFVLIGRGSFIRRYPYPKFANAESTVASGPGGNGPMTP